LAKKKITAVVMPKNEAEWAAHDDAQTLSRAKEIQADKPRYKKAVGMAKKLAAEKLQEATAMRKIANSKT
jgi:hypothetical protein